MLSVLCKITTLEMRSVPTETLADTSLFLCCPFPVSPSLRPLQSPSQNHHFPHPPHQCVGYPRHTVWHVWWPAFPPQSADDNIVITSGHVTTCTSTTSNRWLRLWAFCKLGVTPANSCVSSHGILSANLWVAHTVLTSFTRKLWFKKLKIIYPKS